MESKRALEKPHDIILVALLADFVLAPALMTLIQHG